MIASQSIESYTTWKFLSKLITLYKENTLEQALRMNLGELCMGYGTINKESLYQKSFF